MKKLLAICITAAALAANITVGCLAAENNALPSENQTEISQNDARNFQDDEQNTDDYKNRSADRDSREDLRNERERAADSGYTAEEAGGQSEGSFNNLFSLNNIIIFVCLLLILILNIATLVLNLLSAKKSSEQIDDIKNQIKEKSSNSDNSGLSVQIKGIYNLVKAGDNNIKRIAADVQELKKKSTVNSVHTPAPSKSVESKRTVKLPQSTVSKYNDYLKGNGPLPDGLSTFKIGISGTKPIINNNDGIEFYYENDGTKLNVYPKKEHFDEDFIPNMGTAIITFVKSENGVKRLINAASVTINPTDQTINVIRKGKAEY